MAKRTPTPPPNLRWNFFAFLTDSASWGIAQNFVSASTVLPAFVGQLTDSAPLIGLAGSIFFIGWMTPQIAYGRLIDNKPRKRPYLLGGLVGRPLLALVAVALWAGLAGRPEAMLALFFCCIGLWGLSDSLTGLAWLDILARAIPLRRRARLVGLAQSISGLAGVASGALIAVIIAGNPFPTNYAILFTLGAVLLIPSVVALFAIREPPPETHDAEAGSRPLSRDWLEPLKTDSTFRRLVLCRFLVALGELATSFYVVHATGELRLPQSIVGSFVTAQTAGTVVGAASLSILAERRGPCYAIRIGSAAGAAAPLVALGLQLCGPRSAAVYPLVYVLIGLVGGAYMPGFNNYAMEIPPEGKRAAYLGLGNSIMTIARFAPLAGGWLLESTSFPILFAATGAVTFCGFLAALRIPPLARASDEEGVQ